MTETEPETHQTSRWRTGDMRGDEGMPRSISQVVRQAWIGLLAARIGEAAMLGLTAICLLLAAATFSVLNSRARMCGWWRALAALCVVFPGGLSIALRVRILRASSTASFVTRALSSPPMNWNCARTTDRWGGMLLGQVLTKLRRRDAMRAVRPSLVLPVVAPLLGARRLRPR